MEAYGYQEDEEESLPAGVRVKNALNSSNLAAAIAVFQLQPWQQFDFDHSTVDFSKILAAAVMADEEIPLSWS